MKKIGLLSDTHSFLDDQIFSYFENCDELWHAGDFGNMEVIEKLQAFRPLRGVYGNIDNTEIQQLFPERLHFTCEEVPVCMQHIGGYPGRYAKGIKDAIVESKSKLFISGHSHILKIMSDDKINCLHMNPGACGRQGWHKVRTIVRFSIDGADIKDCEVVELEGRW